MQVVEGNHFRTRVYDRANAPEQVLEILRLSLSSVQSFVPQFKPTREWSAGRAEGDGGALCLSPDGRLIISSNYNGPLKFWRSDTFDLVKEVAEPSGVWGISYSPDGSVALVREGWGELNLLDTRSWRSITKLAEPIIDRKQCRITRPRFTADGRFLLLESNETVLKVFDAKTWEPRDLPPAIPKDAITFIPAPCGDKAVYVSKDGTLMLWNTRKQREIAKLDVDVVVDLVAFSPYRSLIAIVTASKVRDAVPSNNYYPHKRIRIWRLKTGKLVHELRPFEQDVRAIVEGLLWSPDGNYIFAAAAGDAFFTAVDVDVWNAKSGRHRGRFEGCPTHVTGFALLDGGHQLVAGCVNGKIRVWDVDSAFKEIGAFENSVGDNP